MLLEGIFLGVALVIVMLVFEDRKSRELWAKKEMALFGVGLGLALGGFWVESVL